MVLEEPGSCSLPHYVFKSHFPVKTRDTPTGISCKFVSHSRQATHTTLSQSSLPSGHIQWVEDAALWKIHALAALASLDLSYSSTAASPKLPQTHQRQVYMLHPQNVQTKQVFSGYVSLNLAVRHKNPRSVLLVWPPAFAVAPSRRAPITPISPHLAPPVWHTPWHQHLAQGIAKSGAPAGVARVQRSGATDDAPGEPNDGSDGSGRSVTHGFGVKGAISR